MAYIGRDTDKISNVEVLDNITFDGSSSYTLQKGGSNFTPSSANTLLLSIDGVVQAGNFTVSGSTIDFGTAVAGTSTCDFVLHYGVGLITAPSDGTVTTAKVADGAITSAKLASGVGGVAGITSSADATAISIDSSEVVRLPVGVLRLQNSTTGTADTDGLLIEASGNDVYINNKENADMYFRTNNTDRMTITDSGSLFVNATAGITGNAKLVARETLNDDVVQFENTNGSFAERVLLLNAGRSANSAYQFLLTYSGDLTDLEHNLRGDGNAYADGSWNGGGADYAEYFEWLDGNTSNEDRRGYTVVLDENKIRKSTTEDNPNNIIGVISGNPSVIGDTDIGRWKNKYQKDDYGSHIFDENGHKILNTEYNETLNYISREDRQEWDIVGLMGKVRINKSQTVGDRWIKMRDISKTVEEWLIK